MKKLLILIFCTQLIHAFSTIDQAKKYAQGQPEYPPIGNKNAVLNPDYTSWYQQHRPTFMNQIASLFKPYSGWSINQFKAQLISQVKIRENAGLKQPHSLIMKPLPGWEYTIVGPLFGSFHSLVRLLVEFVRQGTIAQDFKITKKNWFLLFDGNVIDGSPYILETLSLVLSLKQANPLTVFYVAGEHEHAEYWQSYGLKTELDVRVADRSFVQYVGRFFATLPRSILLADGHDIVRIGNIAQDADGVDELSCAQMIKDVARGSSKECVLKKAIGDLPLIASIGGEQRLMSYKGHPGLVLLPSESGFIAWSIFSAPNKMYRDYFNFFFDAYVVLKIADSLQQSTLELYHQDVREQAGFKKVAIYGLASGKKMSGICDPKEETCKLQLPVEEKAVEKKPLFIGCTLDLTKGASGQGKVVKIGILLAIDKINEQGGLNGQRIEIIFMDDEYSPEKARQNVETFVKKYDSTLFLCNLGSPTLSAYLDLVKDNKIFIFFPTTGAPAFRKPDLLGVVHWRTSYSNEAIGLVSYALENYGIKDFAFLYQNDSYGKGALEGARKILDQKKITQFLEVSYERNTTYFKSAIEKIKASPARAIGFFSTSIAATEFIRQAGVEFFIGKKLFALSDLAETAFKKFSHQKGLDMVIAQFSPNPATSNLEIIKEYRTALLASGRTQVDVFMLEGFIGASLMVDILRKTQQNYSHEAIMGVIEGMKNYTFKGLNLSFDPRTRELAHLLWLDIGLPEWILQKIGS